jgi:DnaJ-class molecular chaperone
MKWRALDGRHTPWIDRYRQQTPEELLGVVPGANATAIKAAYRRKAMAYHPDRVDAFLRPRAEEMMKLINCAYQSALSRARS